MTALLTLNGIPPTVAGKLTQEHQKAMVASIDGKNFNSSQGNPDWPNAAFRFQEIVNNMTSLFLGWGASISTAWEPHVDLYGKNLVVGETTFMSDLNLHSDRSKAHTKLANDGLLSLRLLCASSTPTSFVDLTYHPDMDSVLEAHRSPREDNLRLFNSTLWAATTENGGRVVTPEPWDVILFDAATPHEPKGAAESNHRILFSAWTDIILPSNWHDRVQRGDVPKLPSLEQGL